MNAADSGHRVVQGLPKWGRGLRRWLGAEAYPALNRWLDPSRQYAQFAYARLLARLVPEDIAWLDAGCGHQVFKLNSIREESAIIARTRLVVGCDLSREALLRHRSLQLRVCCDLSCLPFANAAFNLVSLNYVAEHLEAPDKAFAEVARLLKPGGALVMVTPNSQGYFTRLARLGRKFIPDSLVRKFILIREYRSAEDIFPTFYRANSKNDLVRLLEPAGFSEINMQMLNDPPMFNFILPLAFVELLFGRFLTLLGLETLKAGTIICVCRRTSDRITQIG